MRGSARWSKLPAEVVHDPNLSHRGHAAYCAVAVHADRHGECYPTVGTLAALLGCSEQTVRRGLTECKTAGHVVVTPRGSGRGGRTSNRYRLPLAATATSWAHVPERVLGSGFRAVRMYAWLDLMADRNGVCQPSRHRLADLLGCSPDSVDRDLDELEVARTLVRLPDPGKVTCLRLPHRPVRPEPVHAPTPRADRPSAPVSGNPPHRWEANRANYQIPTDDVGNRERAASSPSSSGRAQNEADRWKRRVCERYAQLVVEGQGDTIDNLNAYRRKVARQALDERADRLDELRASGMAPAEAAELLLADGPTRRPTPAPPRPLGDPLCDDCRGSGMAYTDMSGPVPSGPVIRCSCDPPDPDRPRSSADPWDPWSDLPELGKVTG